MFARRARQLSRAALSKANVAWTRVRRLCLLVTSARRVNLEEHEGGARQTRKRLMARGYELDRIVVVAQRCCGLKVDVAEGLHADDGEDERDKLPQHTRTGARVKRPRTRARAT